MTIWSNLFRLPRTECTHINPTEALPNTHSRVHRVCRPQGISQDKVRFAKRTVHYTYTERIQLTPLFLVQNPERILTRTEIAEKVWDTHFDTGTNFIDVYINYLRKKDRPKNFNTKLIHTKPGMGFIFSYENPY